MRLSLRVSRALLPCLLACLMLGVAPRPGAAAEGAEPEAAPASSIRSRFGVGLEIGYGIGITPRSRQVGKDVGDVRFVSINPHIRFLLWEKKKPTSWIHGQLDGLLIGTILAGLEPNGGYSAGAIADLRYTLLPGHKVRPYVEGGIGIGDLQFHLASQRDGFSFYLQAGGGVRWQVTPGFALTASILWHHISNAQIRFPNNGIDDILFQVGVLSW